MLLFANGLAEPDSNVATPVSEEPKDLANRSVLGSHRLDATTGDVFHRSLQLVLERLVIR